MNHRRLVQIALGYLAVSSAPLGIWGLLAPQSFYENFPGFGRAWIALDGPYNEHLMRDVGALNLALIVLFVGAAISMSKPLVLTACASSLAWGVPHFLYHLFNTDGLSSGDITGVLGGLSAFVTLPLVIIFVMYRNDTDQPALAH